MKLKTAKCYQSCLTEKNKQNFWPTQYLEPVPYSHLQGEGWQEQSSTWETSFKQVNSGVVQPRYHRLYFIYFESIDMGTLWDVQLKSLLLLRTERNILKTAILVYAADRMLSSFTKRGLNRSTQFLLVRKHDPGPTTLESTQSLMALSPAIFSWLTLTILFGKFYHFVFQYFSTWSNFVPQGTLDNVQKCFWLLQLEKWGVAGWAEDAQAPGTQKLAEELLTSCHAQENAHDRKLCEPKYEEYQGRNTLSHLEILL